MTSPDRSVCITAWARLDGAEAASLEARRELPERKHLKLMTREVRLGVAAVGRALGARPGWESVVPERRGLFVGTRPVGAPEDLAPALDVARDGDRLDLRRFGEEGLRRMHPLWLVKGLSNNIVGYASAYWDLRGPAANRCEGRVGGLAAVVEAVRAVAEGRVDLAIAGGADDLGTPPPWETRSTGEGAAFVVVEASPGRPVVEAEVRLDPTLTTADERPIDGLELGAATGVIRLVRALEAGGGPVEIAVVDGRAGLRARIGLG